MLASRSMRNRLIAAVFAALAAACGTINQGPVPRATTPSGAVDEIASWMCGAFSSGAQAAKDPVHFKPVTLHMAPIWIDRTDGRWLYVEQAMVDSPQKPYRQRVYCVRDDGDAVESRVFELPGDVAKWTGAWSDPSRFDALLPSQLVPREGCAVRLKRQPDGSWKGGTDGQGCESTRQGASYATSEVLLCRDRIETWDRGFDRTGKQVWGATEGPYVFVKETSK